MPDSDPRVPRSRAPWTIVIVAAVAVSAGAWHLVRGGSDPVAGTLLAGCPGAVVGLDTSPDGRHLLACWRSWQQPTDDRPGFGAILFDMTTGSEIRRYDGTAEARFVTSGTVQLLHHRSGGEPTTELRSIEPGEDVACAASGDGMHVAADGGDSLILAGRANWGRSWVWQGTVIDVRNGGIRRSWCTGTIPGRIIGRPDGNRYVILCSPVRAGRHRTQVLDLYDGRLLLDFEDTSGTVDAMVERTGTFAVIAAEGGRCRVFGLADGKCFRETWIGKPQVLLTAVDPSGVAVAWCTQDKRHYGFGSPFATKLWQGRDPESTVDVPNGDRVMVMLLQTADVLVTGTWDGRVEIWRKR